MAHFVNIPPGKNYQVPHVKELPLLDRNGTAAIAVWGSPPGAAIFAFNRLSNIYNSRFVAAPYHPPHHHEPDLTYFYLRGLVTGDEIAVGYVKPGETQTTMVTDWLPISRVVADHFAAKRAAGLMPRSPYKLNFLLDPVGSEQRFPPVPEDKWVKAVNDAILKVATNPIGKAVMGGITRETVIVPWIPSVRNADSAITFTPQAYNGAEPASSPDEVLCHEMVHVLENNYSGYKDNATDGLHFDGSDFMSITITNVYASCNGRSLRKDHRGHLLLPDIYAKDAKAYRSAYKESFADFEKRCGIYSELFGAASAASWNPFALDADLNPRTSCSV